MTPARLAVAEPGGRREVVIDKPVFGIGRRATADLQIISRDISREHAEIRQTDGTCFVRDCGSRFGTFVNGEPVAEPRALVHGDRIRLGRTSEIELTFLSDGTATSGFTDTKGSISDLGQMAAVLNGLRALGSGRVLDEVLTLVLDSALEVTAAERGFIMLAGPSGALEMKVARGRHFVTLSDATFSTSQKIPREVFATGASRIVGDLLEGSLAGAHEGTLAMGIRHVLCVPLRIVPFGAASAAPPAQGLIGVLYLDGRERGTLLSAQTRSSLEAFATQAALAIESARLYAEAAEKARLERDLRLAAQMQQALLPEPRFRGASLELAACSVPCRTIGGDFFDYLDVGPDLFGFALGDVAGKGPPAALLAAAVQSNFVAQAPVAVDPADAMARLNRALLRRAVDARFATMFYGALSPDGRLSYCNAGQEPPLVVRQDGSIELLDAGGPVLGLLAVARYEPGTTALLPGDLVVVYSDGVTEARNVSGGEYGRERLVEFVTARRAEEPERLIEELLASIRGFSGSEPQADDITALILKYHPGNHPGNRVS